MLSSLSLPLALLAAGAASALPVSHLDPRIVGTITCTPFNFSSPDTRLFVNSTTAATEGADAKNETLEVGYFAGADAERDLSAFASANPRRYEGNFGFEVCESGLMKSDDLNSTSLFGHATYTATNGSVFCLTVTYPYKGQAVKLEECSVSDDSSQFLQWWQLTNTTAAPILEFAGPVIVPNNPPLSPASTDPSPFAPVTLARKNETEAFLFFGPSETEVKKGLALEKAPEKKASA